jgi:aryl-alcohol dehydrogenase-like predicted oxidoreductase
VNWIDTAGAYGLGHSERVIARALKGMSERPYVFTKCTSTWDGAGNIESKLKSESIRREVEGSLSRLEVDVLDVCQLHIPVPDEDIEEGWSTLAELREEGKVRFIGVSNFDVPQMQRAHAIAPVTSAQPIYNLLNREIEEEVLPFCEVESIGVIVYSPMASGLLTGRMSPERIESLPADDWRRRWPDFLSPRVDHTFELVEKLRPVADRHGRSVAQLAIAWTLRNPVVTGATVGFRSPEQVDDLCAAGSFILTPGDLGEIEAALPEETLFAMSMEGTVSADAMPAT